MVVEAKCSLFARDMMMMEEDKENTAWSDNWNSQGGSSPGLGNAPDFSHISLFRSWVEAYVCILCEHNVHPEN